MTLTWPYAPAAPAGNQDRFGGRWCLAGAGLSNVWRYGDLELPAPSGRLLLRGPNGTGKTTALEALWPYLLDLNQSRLGAGRGRTTHLSSLMREGADGRRRVGYVWVTFAAPETQETITYGVRLAFSEGGTPPVRIAPFTVPARPLHELPLWGPGRATLSAEQFDDAVAALGGIVFGDDDAYVRDLATRVLATDPQNVDLLAQRIREVRNPALLADLSPNAAAEALRASLPGVDEAVIEATAEALAESDATRQAFEDDRAAAETLGAFARVWTGHAVDVCSVYLDRATTAAAAAAELARKAKRLASERDGAVRDAEAAKETERNLDAEANDAQSRLRALEQSGDYRTVGALTELAKTIAKAQEAADARWRALDQAARTARRARDEDIAHLIGLADDVHATISQVAALAPASAGLHVASWHDEPRSPFVVGDDVTDAGPALRVEADEQALADAVETLRAEATERERAADHARLLITAHQTVADAESEEQRAKDEARRLAKNADDAGEQARAAASSALEEAHALRDDLAVWLADTREVGGPIDGDVVAQAAWDEPASALAAADQWEDEVAGWSHAKAEQANARAAQLDERADAAETEAAARQREADQLRAGKVLPLPRPEWTGPGEDERALGSVLVWRGGLDPETEDVIEATLAAAGMLGATLTAAGAQTDTWRADTTGEAVQNSLSGVLTVDPDHPLAEVAQLVLDRVELRDTATDGVSPLVVGRDGTFRAGVLVGAVPAARDTALRPRAAHVGARRRREAALARAAEVELEAATLLTEAEDDRAAADQERARASNVRNLHRRFPSRDELRDAESKRVAAVRLQADLDDRATKAEREADHRGAVAQEERQRWIARARDAGLPADTAALTEIVRNARADVSDLRKAATQLDTRLRKRLVAIVAAVANHDATTDLRQLHGAAIEAHEEHVAEQSRYDELHAQLGMSPDAVLHRHSELKRNATRLQSQLRQARDTTLQTASTAAARQAEAEVADTAAAQARPVAAASTSELRHLLTVPGVVDAVLGGAELAANDDELHARVAEALRGRERFTKRTLRERADDTRARLAGVWSVDPGPDHPELDTYLLTHGSTSFTPVPAADQAGRLAAQAEEALKAADEQALRDFVIGRLPAAVGEAWTRLSDWVRDVNAKMRVASASSGVGVAVRVTAKHDLPVLVRTIYDLTCRSGDALRDTAAKEQAGRAIHQLITAAVGEDMATRVRAAVDVREWVDVTYQVTRPGQEPKNWGPKTGLSGGERRLVVLAPMLAAVAAAYDRFPATAGRVVALDEVPSEVDDEGREGLARYIAELDLDLIATSHGWDGAPGAWDGVDAHDLEAAGDGTVVAFPMVIRGLEVLPGDGGSALPPV